MRSIGKIQMKSTISWPYMMTNIWTLGSGGEGHFTKGNIGKKSEKFDMFKK